MNNNIKVQIVCVTYNQKNYIKDALNSFLMQKTNFKFEVLVGDDCSNDGTTEIIVEYAKEYPDIIKHIHRESNMGCLANFIDLCESITAKYVAFCDGDDYWTDENKLQKQFDFMEKNEDVNVCAHKVHVECDKSCSNYAYYANLPEAFTLPTKQKFSKKITVNEIIQDLPQMSSLFIRWQNIKFPNWSKEGIFGDFPVCLLNLGDKKAYILNESMSVYRKNENGVDYNKGTLELHFINTRMEHFKVYTNAIEWFKINHPNCNVSGIESRLWTETVNYTNAIIKTDRYDLLLELKKQYPNVYAMVKSLFSEYRFRLQQINVFGLKRANILRKKWVLRLIKPYLNTIYRIEKFYKQVHSLIKTIHSFLAYWIFALVPKKKNLWVFSGFNKKNYMDNTKYLYEYIVHNCPEIEAVWLTKSKEVRKKLKEQKMPVHRMNSLIGIWKMIRANIAFSDHFKMSDYDNRYGFNAKTKFINMFHGFGPKGMKPIGDKIPNTTIPGVRLSSDIINTENDNFFVKIKKMLKYPFVAPFRELFEEYFGMVCPGQPCNDYFATPWKVKKEAQLNCGYPRSTKIHCGQKNDIYKILYAPTYRWNSQDERNMIDSFIENIPKINNFLVKVNGEFVLRLHPHTWRDYRNKILLSIKDYSKISISSEKDIYDTLDTYSLLITDYSSLGWEYLLTGNPMINFAFDYETYQKTDCPFDMDYKNICVGEIIKTWDNLVMEMQEYYNNPDKNIGLRNSIKEFFYPSSRNDAENSKKLVEIIQNKLRKK